jgi:hypothetical protein
MELLNRTIKMSLFPITLTFSGNEFLALLFKLLIHFLKRICMRTRQKNQNLEIWVIVNCAGFVGIFQAVVSGGPNKVYICE